MGGFELAAIGFAIMLLAIFLRMPIAIAMGLTAFFGIWASIGTPVGILSQLKTLSYGVFATDGLSIVPLFLLMGQFATKSGMSSALFKAGEAWVGHKRGGIALAAVGGCAGFGAVCGSSLATASTMGQVALPEMRKYGYSDALSTGVLAAGGTLGILIPPSIILIIYAIFAEQNIEKMFAAALLPGLLAAAGYMFVVWLYATLAPGSASKAQRLPYGERFKALLGIWPVLVIFFMVIGGIYLGFFTPNQAASFGAVATALYGIANGGIRIGEFFDAIQKTAVTTAMIFLIILGAEVFKIFLATTRTPQIMADWVSTAGYDPMTILVLILITYLIFGCVMDSLSMILLTMPLFLPIITVLDFGMTPDETLIWFGILALIVVEVGLITPPVGMNLFIINGMAKDIPIRETYKGVIPFVLSDLLRVVVLVVFPSITLWLVGFV